MCQAFLPLLRKSRAGRIVNVSSEAGSLAHMSGGPPAYQVTKAALNALTRTLAGELRREHILVNAVCPGWVKTEMDAADQSSASYTDDDIINRVPMARFASPQDIAQAILFLADENKSGFVNGHTLVVDGGWTADASWESLRLRHR